MKDGTTGTVLHIYHGEAVAVVDVNDVIINIPISELTKDKPNENQEL